MFLPDIQVYVRTCTCTWWCITDLEKFCESFVWLLVLLAATNLACSAEMVTAEPCRAVKFCLHWVITRKQQSIWLKKNLLFLLAIPSNNWWSEWGPKHTKLAIESEQQLNKDLLYQKSYALHNFQRACKWWHGNKMNVKLTLELLAWDHTIWQITQVMLIPLFWLVPRYIILENDKWDRINHVISGDFPRWVRHHIIIAVRLL